MARKKRRRRQAAKPQRATVHVAKEERRSRVRIPRWGWALLFLLPLVASEAMFYMAGRRGSMILFPLAWGGFWVAVTRRSGLPILQRNAGTAREQGSE